MKLISLLLLSLSSTPAFAAEEMPPLLNCYFEDLNKEYTYRWDDTAGHSFENTCVCSPLKTINSLTGREFSKPELAKIYSRDALDSGYAFGPDCTGIHLVGQKFNSLIGEAEKVLTSHTDAVSSETQFKFAPLRLECQRSPSFFRSGVFRLTSGLRGSANYVETVHYGRNLEETEVHQVYTNPDDSVRMSKKGKSTRSGKSALVACCENADCAKGMLQRNQEKLKAAVDNAAEGSVAPKAP